MDGQQENGIHTEVVVKHTVKVRNRWTTEARHHGSVAMLDTEPQDLRDARCFTKSFINQSLVPKLGSVNIGRF